MTHARTMTESTAADTLSSPAEPATNPGEAAPQGGRKGKSRPPKSDVMPVLEQLAALHPALFGAQFLPLKRGIFQDLMDAHPEAFEREALKAALSLHTRSTRYLIAVSSGAQRHDLTGQPWRPWPPNTCTTPCWKYFAAARPAPRTTCAPSCASVWPRLSRPRV